MIRTKKICAGAYVVTDGTRSVRVTRVHYPNDGTYWIAAADWDRHLLTDPVRTKGEAAEYARGMIEREVRNG